MTTEERLDRLEKALLLLTTEVMPGSRTVATVYPDGTTDNTRTLRAILREIASELVP